MSIEARKVSRITPVGLAEIAAIGFAFSLGSKPVEKKSKFIRTAISTAASLEKIKSYMEDRTAGDTPTRFQDVLANINDPDVRNRIFGSEDNSYLVYEFKFDPSANQASIYLDEINEKYLSLGLQPPLIVSKYFKTINQMREDVITSIDDAVISLDF